MLDPATLTCDLYAARPLTCRTFGPPLRGASGALGVCELCFDGASEEEIAACEAQLNPEDLSEDGGVTTVAQALGFCQ